MHCPMCRNTDPFPIECDPKKLKDAAKKENQRDAKLYEIGAGTSEIRRMLIGREISEGN